MKWAKVGKPSRTTPADEIASYEFYADQAALDKKFGIVRPRPGSGDRVPDEQQPNLWKTYEFDRYMAPEKQRDYEIFSGGFLLFYDREVRNKAIDHTIYFEWSPKKGEGLFT